MPTAEELDTVSAGRPAFLRRGGSNVVLNTHASRLLDVERTSAGEEGATVVRRADGLPTGHIVGTAYVGRLAARLPAIPEERKRQALATGGRAYARAGVTSVVEPGLAPEDIELVRRLGADGKLRLRVRMMWRITTSDREIEQAVRALRSMWAHSRSASSGPACSASSWASTAASRPADTASRTRAPTI